MELGVTEEALSSSPVSSLKLGSVPEKQTKARKTHPRYSFYAYGCSSTLYQCVTSETESMYHSLLRAGDGIVEHPRPRNMYMVRTLKPGLNSSKETVSWVDDEYLTGEVGDPLDEVVESFVDSSGDIERSI